MNDFYRKIGKNAIDRVLAACGLAVLSLIIVVTAIIVRLKLGSPVLFRQERVGLNGKKFLLYKFRSMTNEKDENGKYLPDEVRLGTFGKKLRSTSLDELPSLWNVMKGDMALIGPRPLPIRYLPWYTKEEKRRHDVRPGITGLAQVNGRNYVSWEDKFRMDVEYVDNLSLRLDLQIFFKTVQIVLQHSDIDTGTFIEHNGVIYRPLDVERMSQKDKEQDEAE